ncbi:Ig-like domain-containing protein [Niveibacterium terrae]|uniref:Ig-like domain-containing protein n=1 Tax=Niveibacterium terrae TaxID=3373598 RepID=UPI003A916736
MPAAVEVRAADPGQDHGKKEVVVVDTSVADYKTLEAGIAAGIGILEIDGSKDGLALLAKWAQGQSGYDSISILSHGSEAQLHLGTNTVTETSLSSATTQAELAAIGQALTADGDLLLYGCDVAKGTDGTAFISDLAKATGADVAASSDATGAASMGGNWVTEFHSGQIDVQNMDISSYAHLLSVNGTSVTVTASNDPSTEYYALTSVGSGVEFDNNGNPIDVDPTNNTITITYSSGASLDTSFDLVFQGGSLDHFTGISKTSSSGQNPYDVTATVSGKTIHIDVGNGGFTNGTIVFTFTSVNVSTDTAPTVTGSATNPTYTENGSSVSLFSGVTASTNDSGQTFSGAVFTVSNVADSTEYLTINGVDVALTNGNALSLGSGYGTASVSKSANTAIVSISGAMLSGSSMSTLLSSMSYRNSSENPSVTARTVTLSQLTDSGSTNNTASPSLSSQVTVHAVNDAPTDISLTSNSIGQSLGSNGTVGTLSATDVDSNSFTYSLVSGTGSTDNSRFSITGSTLKVNDAATMAAGIYSVRVQVSDGTDTYQKIFSVTVSDDVRPVFDVAPAATNISATGLDLSASLDEAGTIYYVIVADGSAAPSVSQVISGQNAAGSTAIGSGSHVVSSAPYSYSFNVAGLNSGTSYDIYLVAKDSANNQILSATKVDVTTSTNTAPVFSSLNGGATYTENGSAVVIDNDVTVSDTELDALGDYSGASITIARSGGASSNDIFGNSGLLGSLTQGQSFTYNGTVVGTVTTNSGGSLTLSFNSSATSAIANAVLQSITYANSSDDPPSSVSLNWTFSDGSLNSAGSNQAVLSITPVNDVPVISTTSVSKTFNEDSAQSFSASDFGFSDVDSGDSLQSVTIVAAPTAGELFIDANSDGVRDSGDTLLGNGAVVSAANIGKLTFRPAANANGTGYSSFTWTVSDGTASSANTGTMTLNVTPVNDAPVISTTSVSKTFNEDSAQSFSASDFGFSDVDSGDTLQAITIVTAPSAGELFIDANNDGVRNPGDTLLGNGSVVSAADIGKLTYRPAANANGTGYSSFTWKVSDGTASSHNTGTMTLNVTPVNDAPTLSSGVTVTLTSTTEDVTSSATTVSALLSSAGYGDVDSGAASGIAITSTLGNGGWQYSTDSGANWFNIGTTSGSSALLLAATAQLRYVPDSRNGETASLAFKAWDQTSATASVGASKGVADTSTSGGASAFSANSAQASLAVTSVNDAPTLNQPIISQSATESISFSYSLPSNVFVDVDSGDSLTLSATLSDGSALPAWLSFNPATGTFSGTPGRSDVGNQVVRVTATDSSHASVSTTFSLSVAKFDTTLPTATVAMSDSALKAGDSSLVTITFSEPVAGFDNSDLTVDGGILSTLTSKDGGTTWTAVFTPDSNLERTANAITLNMSGVKDLSDNYGTGTVSSVIYAIDTAAPLAPTLVLNSASDSGASNTDRITSVSAPTITGTAEAGSAVTLYEGATVLGTTTADGSGNWSFTSSALTDGSHNLTAKATDAAGNVSAAGSLTLSVDTVAPAVPTLNLSAASDSGASNTDRITSVSAPTITGTAEAGSSVTLYEGSTVLGTTTADSSGNWSITSSVVADGSHNLTARATDAAGNVSTAGSLTLSVDTAASVTPVLALSPASDSGSSSSDRITKVTTPTINGTAEAGSTVTLYEGSAVLGSATADGSGNWSITSSLLADGNHNLTARASDAAGNVSAAGNLALTVDTTAPATPVLALSPASDSGASNTDRLTNVTTPTLTGTAEAGSSVTLYEGSAVLGTATADGSGNWSITSSTLTDGSHSLTARASDAAGNASGVSSVLSVTVDTSAPSAPTLVLDPASDSGSSSSDRITNVTTPTLTGTAEAGSSVTLYEGSAVLGSATADGSGNWSITSSTLADGSHNLTAKATDAAGNVSAAGSLALSVDTAAPAAPGLAMSPASDSGASNADRITNVAAPTLTGSAEANATVTLYEGAKLLGSTTSDASGHWTFVCPSLSDGAHDLTATAIDEAGNVSAAGSLTLSVDTAAPAAPGLAMSPASDSGASNADRITKVTTPTLTGTAEVGSTVTLYEGAKLLGSTTADASGHWTFVSPSLSDGAHDLTATATDAAGNVSASGSLTLSVDTAAPAAPSLALSPASDSGASNAGRITNLAAPTLTGSAEANATVTLYEGAKLLGSTTSDASGHWAFVCPSLSDGAHDLTATATDAAGNSSPASTALSIQIDTVSPTATVLLSESELKAGQTATVTIVFSEAVTDLPATSLDVQGGSLSELNSSDGGRTWTGIFSPATDVVSASNQITLNLGGIHDLAGNVGKGTTSSPTYSIDTHPATTNPTPTPGQDSGSFPSSSTAPAVIAPSPSGELASAPLSFLPPSSAISNTRVVAESVSAQSGVLSVVSSGRSGTVDSTVRAVGPMPVPTAQTSTLSDSALVVSRGVPDLKLSGSSRSEISIPSDAFAHSDPNAKLSFSLSRADGRALPNWVQFDQASGKLIVHAPEGYEGVLDIRIVARDSKGHEAVTTFHIVVGKGGKTLEHAQPAGRASLSEQIHKAAHRSGGLRERLVAFAQTDALALRRRA